MKNIIFDIFAFFSIAFLVNGCAGVAKSSDLKPEKEFFVLKIRDAFEKKISQDVFYFLTETTHETLYGSLNKLYIDKYDFYDTLQYKLNAKCILDFGVKYWQNSCNIGKLSYAIPSSQVDSLQDANLLRTIEYDSSYAFRFLDFMNPSGSQLYIGISKVKCSSHCTAISKMNVCILPEMDSIVILRKGFTIEPIKITKN